MNINANKKAACPIGMKYPQKPSPIYIPTDVGHALKGDSYITRIVHSQK